MRFFELFREICRLELFSFERREDRSGDLFEIRDEGERLCERVVLREWYEVEVFVVAKRADVFCRAGKGVVCGRRDDDGALVSEMAFYCHADGRNGVWLVIAKICQILRGVL